MKNKNIKHKKNSVSALFYLPIYFIIGLIPHLYYYMVPKLAATESLLFFGVSPTDLYTLVKAKALLLLTVISVILFLYGIVSKKIYFKFDLFSKLMSGFGVIVIISSFFSKYQDLVYFGGRERFEGMWVYLCYIVLAIMAKTYSQNKNFISGLMKSLLYSSFVMSIIGMIQVLNYDIYTQSPLKWFIFPKEIASNIATAVRVDIDYGAVASLYHSNYFGVFMVMGSIIAILNILNDEKKNMNLVFSLFLIFGVIASSSEASMFAFAVAISGVFYFKFDEIKKNYKYMGGLVFAFIIEVIYISSTYRFEIGKQKYFYAMLIVGSIICALLGRIKIEKSREKILNGLIIFVVLLGLFIVPFAGVKLLKSESPIVKIEKFEMEENVLAFKTEDMNSDLIMTFFPDTFSINEDENASATLNLEQKTMVVTRNDKTISFLMEYYEAGKFFVKFNDYNIVLRYEDGNLRYTDYRGNILENSEIRKIGFLDENGFQFSARGYIWSRFIPVTMDSPVIGNGADVYPYIFPQEDYVAKYNLYGNAKMIVDKPHSIYLDWILSFGYLGFALIMGAILVTIYNGLLKRRSFDIPAMLVMLAVLSSGLFNDSIVGISQIFFVFLGVTSGEYIERVDG